MLNISDAIIPFSFFSTAVTQDEFTQNSCPAIPMNYDDSPVLSNKEVHKELTGMFVSINLSQGSTAV